LSEDEELVPEAKVYRHKEPVGDVEFSVGDPELIEDVRAHIEAHIGPIASAFHELVSPYVH